MPNKTVILEVPENFDFAKVTALINAGVGFRILKPTETLRVIEAAPDGNGKKKIASVFRKPGQSTIGTVMSHYTHKGEFISLQAQAWVKEAGYNERSASPALTALKKEGYIEQIAAGRWRFLKPLPLNHKFGAHS